MTPWRIIATLATMKVLIAILPLLSLAAASLQATCEECSAVVTTLATGLTSDDSVEMQVRILLSEVCPQSENPDECVEKLPDFWGRVAAVLWPGYYDPTADWMCGSICTEQSPRDVSCEECTSGIQGTMILLLTGCVDLSAQNSLQGMLAVRSVPVVSSAIFTSLSLNHSSP